MGLVVPLHRGMCVHLCMCGGAFPGMCVHATVLSVLHPQVQHPCQALSFSSGILSWQLGNRVMVCGEAGEKVQNMDSEIGPSSAACFLYGLGQCTYPFCASVSVKLGAVIAPPV